MPQPSDRSRRAAALRVVVVLGICGALLGVAWAWLAPPIHTVTALSKSGERVDAFLGKEADKLFVAAAIMIGLLTMLAIVSAVAVWQWRIHRGPLLVTALWIGQVAAAGAAVGVGAAMAHWRYGTPDHQGVPLSPENRVHYFTEAPPVLLGHGPFQVAVTLLLPAALAALVYSLAAVGTPRDDLGAWPPERGGTWSTADGTAPVHRA
ncbi:MAG: DUF2567 domain-containing protein [Mycobacterium sp.]